jgi:hypothetical protein
MRRVLAAALVLAASPAFADCDHFKWSVAKEIAAFAAPAPLPASGGMAAPGQGFALTLAKDMALPIPPERAPKPGTYAGVVTTPKLSAGLYQVTLSAPAWVDVAQNGTLVKSSDFSGQKDCPSVHKSVRFRLAEGPATIEVSDAAAAKLLISIIPAP